MRFDVIAWLWLALLIPFSASGQQEIEMEAMEIIGFQPGSDEYKLAQWYARDLAEVERRTVQTYLGALSNFETTIRSASSTEAQADVLGAVFSSVFDQTKAAVVDAIGSEIPGFGQVVAVFEAVDAEIERAQKAKESYEVGDWIQTQRTDILRIANAAPIDSRIEQELITQYNALPDEEKNDFIVALDKARGKLSDRSTNALRAGVVPDPRRVELWLYETWINKHGGVIEFRYDENDSEESPFVLESVDVNDAPFADHIEDGIARVINDNIVPNLGAVRVGKRLCLYVENFVGGMSWSCGLRNASNGVVQAPIHPTAQQPFVDLWENAALQGSFYHRD
jgi:hypothetical protein